MTGNRGVAQRPAPARKHKVLSSISSAKKNRVEIMLYLSLKEFRNKPREREKKGILEKGSTYVKAQKHETNEDILDAINNVGSWIIESIV